MRLPSVPGPRDVIALVDRGGETVERLLAVLPRVVPLVERAELVLGEVERLVRRIEGTRKSAAALITRIQEPVARILALLDSLEPPLAQLAPTLERLAETMEPREVDALVGLVDHLPVLLVRVEHEVLPMMARLDTVAPDLKELLEASHELNEMLGKLPGMGRIKKKVDEEQAAEDESA